MIVPVILAGGFGSRLWPLSRRLYPKQLLNLINDNTLLQNTILRVKGFNNTQNPIVICNEDHRFIVAEQLRRININDASIVLEPIAKNTAPAVAVASILSLLKGDDPILFILPADHNIDNNDMFYESMKVAIQYANHGYLVNFGITPRSPETGYGYIKKGSPLSSLPGSEDENKISKVVSIDSFVEKPDLLTAKQYVDSDQYCWNSGMFMFKASKGLEELKKFAPDIVAECERAVLDASKDLDFLRLNKTSFEKCPEDSIDYAVMEKTKKGVMVQIDAGWNDLGSWESLWEVSKKDENQNFVKGDVIVKDVKNSLIYAKNRMVAAIGIDNQVIIETPDAVLIASKERSQEVKDIVKQLKKSDRNEAVSHKKVYRPWGSYETIDIEERFQVKRITVKPGAVLSLQKHYHRAEHWVVVKGTALATKGDKEVIIRENESTFIPLGQIHRLENPGKIPLEIIEIQSGSYLGEDDIIRFEDVYGRLE